jgi:hypothetical protein
MWRETETKLHLDKPDDVKVRRELKPGDIVERGGRHGGVTVNIVDDDHARIYVLQSQTVVFAGEGIDPRTRNSTHQIMPASVEQTIERESIHIMGSSIGKTTVVEWYPSNPGGK